MKTRKPKGGAILLRPDPELLKKLIEEAERELRPSAAAMALVILERYFLPPERGRAGLLVGSESRSKP